MLIAQESILFNETIVNSQDIWLQSNSTIQILSSIIINESLLETDCSCSSDGTGTCTPWTFVYPLLWPSPNNNIFQIENFTNELSYESTPLNSLTIYCLDTIQIVDSLLRFSVMGIVAF